MKILIATGIYPPDIGGPAEYARGVEEAWRKAGHEVKVLAFSALRRTSVLRWVLPSGIRHLYYFLRVLLLLPGVDFVFSPDTFSASLPALLAAKMCGKKIIIRTGGDFLWEQYVERTGDLVLFREFYTSPVFRFNLNSRFRLNLKERVIFLMIWFLFRHADAIIWSTAWQRDIFEKPYCLDLKKCFIVENYYATPMTRIHPNIPNADAIHKVFVGGTRDLKLKNVPLLRRAFALAKARRHEIELDLKPVPHEQFLEKIKNAFAVILVSLGDISPNMIIEAIQCGTPFILTRETGLYEKLKDIGVWVDPEDVNDIAAKIEWLADEKNYMEQRRKVAAFAFTHGWYDIADEILRIFNTLVESS